MSHIEMAEPPAKKASVRPKVSVMVNAAITTLAGKKGSSLHAINKYIEANYNADAQKLSVYTKKYLKSAVESGELIQLTGKGANGSFKMNKQKIAAEPKTSQAKSSKLPTRQTSTPKKTLKPKKASTPPDESPVTRMESADDEDAPADSTFTIPNQKIPKKPKVAVSLKTKKSRVSQPVKVKKPKKLKVKEPKVNGSPKAKLDKATAIVKPKSAPKSKAKKNAKPTSTPEKTLKPKKASTPPDESPVTWMESADDEDAPADSTFTIPNAEIKNKPKVSVRTKMTKSRDSLPVKVKKPKKLMAKKVQLPKADGSPKGKPDNATAFMKPKSTPYPKVKKSTKPTSTPKKASTPDISPVKSMKSVDDEDSSSDSTFAIGNAEITKKPEVDEHTIMKKSRIPLPKKPNVKEPKVDGSPKEKLDNATAFMKPKGAPKPKAKKSAKPTSTPEKTLKPKKASTPPDESPVTWVESADDEDAIADSTFTIGKAEITKKPKVSISFKTKKSRVSRHVKVKKPKKLKVKEPKVDGSPKVEPDNITAFVKPKGTSIQKAKKIAKPGKSGASVTKKTVSKKTSAEAKSK